MSGVLVKDSSIPLASRRWSGVLSLKQGSSGIIERHSGLRLGILIEKGSSFVQKTPPLPQT